MTDPPRTASLSTLQSYRHYRGGTYTLLYVAENSEDRSELLAVYVSHLTQKVLVRPWSMFREEVVWQDGQRRPRFLDVELAPEFPAEHSAEFYQQVAMYHAIAEEAADARVAELEARVVELEAKLADSGLTRIEGLLVNLCNRVGA
jgi:hypothetical protein